MTRQSRRGALVERRRHAIRAGGAACSTGQSAGLGPGLVVTVLAILVVYTGLDPTSGGADQGSTKTTETFAGRVTKVVDGDTFWLSLRNVRIRV